MREQVKLQLEALKAAREARTRLASAVQEYKAAMKVCERAGKAAADMLGHVGARDYFASVGEVSKPWLDKVQSIADSLDETLDMLVREGRDIVLYSLDEDEADELCNLIAEGATPEMLASMDRDARAEFMARRLVMGLPVSPGGSAGEEPDREKVERCASSWLCRCIPAGGIQ